MKFRSTIAPRWWLLVAASAITTPVTTFAAVLAQDELSSYTSGSGNLLGQSAGGVGFAGNWHAVGSTPPLVANLDVFADESVGSVGTVFDSNAGNAVNFASPISIAGSQLFIRYTHTNLDTSRPQASTRLDVNLNSEATGPCCTGLGTRAFLGAFETDTLKLVLEDPLHTGSGRLSADSGIASTSGSGAHVVVGLLDEAFGQMAIWVDPNISDFYNSQSGANSADAVSTWGVPPGGLTNFVSYSLVRSRLSAVKFDDVTFATSATDVGIASVPVPNSIGLLGLGALGFLRKRIVNRDTV